MAAPPSTLPGEASPSLEAEAARYALLRRLAPSMRHHLVVNLQPIGMIYEVMERRLRAPEPDLAHLHESAGKINGFAKAALASSIDVVSWLAPDDSVAVAVEAAVQECAALLATSLGFRGYALRNHASALPGTVLRTGIRHLLAASLLHCSDHTPAPADLEVRCADEGDHARVSIEIRRTPGEKVFGGEPAYRKITWDDLQALGAAEGVRLAREGDRIDLRLAWVARG